MNLSARKKFIVYDMNSVNNLTEMNTSNVITNTTGDSDDDNKEDTTVFIVIGVSVAVILYCYFCNRNEHRDRVDVEERAARAQARIDIRNGVY